MKARRLNWMAIGLILVLVLAPSLWVSQSGEPVSASDSEQLVETAGTVDWLEPRGLNIVDLVGMVPEEYLQGHIISNTSGYGIVRYEAGTRLGNTVVITTTVYPRYIKDARTGWTASMFGCLGQPARIDHVGSVAPATTMRLYYNGQDVTQQVDLYTYVPAGLKQPIRNPSQSESQNLYRYWETGVLSTNFTGDGDLYLPANMGCELLMSGENYPQLTAVFTAQVFSQVSVETLGVETLSFHSYLGTGYLGHFESLRSQLSAAGYEGRHDKFDLQIPVDADYLFVNFPPTPVDEYTNFSGNPMDNVMRPTGGTYRVANAAGTLSVDHTVSVGIPRYGYWEDSGLVGSVAYLPYKQNVYHLAAPEYIVPAGISYDPCMVYGGCSSAFLSNLWNTEMTLQVLYLKVERTGCDLTRVPLRSVGSGWSSSLAYTPWQPETLPLLDSTAMSVFETAVFSNHVYLPCVLQRFCILPPDDPAAGPYGWFTPEGRMVDYVP